ncbi:MAG: helix-turn-helix transcriptional regulator, partial [Acidobacteria bacterium]|nr:helix-turn-helix transcriptional regulator [Acidobacteriota bacterium]
DILLVHGEGGHGVEEFHGGGRRAVEIVFLPELLAGPGAMECDLWLLRMFCRSRGGLARLGAGDALAGAAWGWVKALTARGQEAGDDPGSRARRKHALCGLLLVMSEALPERMRTGCDGETKRSRVRRLAPLFDHLAAHMQEHVGVGEAAGIVRMSESYFTRFFRAAMGMNYSAYVEELRVNRAYELLVGEGGMSLAEIAEEAGFCDQCHLSRHFRRRFGASPGRVRAREREGRLAGGVSGGERGFEPSEHG